MTRRTFCTAIRYGLIRGTLSLRWKSRTTLVWSIRGIKTVKRSFKRIDTLPVIILGLKRDLRSETDPNGIIYPQEAYQMAQSLRADRYVECSAVTGELVKLAFEDMCKTAVKTATPGGGQSAGSCTVQ